MLIEKTEKERPKLEKQTFSASDELIEASDLLYQVLNASYMCSGTPVEIEVNGNREDIQSLYRKCKDRMQRVISGGSKTEFLAMSILEDTFKKAYPLLLVSVKDLVEGKTEQVIAAKRLMELFQDNPYTKLWNEKSQKYRDLIERLGFTVTTEDYADLTTIMDPLLDAFTFYQKRKHGGPPEIYRIRSGKRSNHKPQIMTDVCIFRSEKEIVDAVSSCGKESVIAFCAMEKTNQQVKDYYFKWYQGYPDERQRNTMRNNKWTTEEYLTGPAEYTREVFLCVKSADTIWLMPMPYKNNGYKKYSDQSSKYYYGDRAGYAPYEVFYKDNVPADKNTTFLTIPKKGYPLSSIMDEMQKIWLPAFLDETIHLFFDATPKATDLLLPEEAQIVINKKEGNSIKGTIVPMGVSLPSTEVSTLKAFTPEEIFQDRHYLITLADRFGIDTESLVDVPLLPNRLTTKEGRLEEIRKHTKGAYLKILGEKIADYLTDKWNIREWIVDSIYSNFEAIANAVTEGALEPFTTTVIDGELVLDENGNQVYCSSHLWPYEKKPQKMQTSKDDCKIFSNNELKRKTSPFVLWLGPSTTSKPPIVLKIRPCSRNDYQILFQYCNVSEPDFFQIVDECNQFYREFSDVLPRDLTNKYVTLSYFRKEDRMLRSTFLPRLADINVCMSKTSYKKYIINRRK